MASDGTFQLPHIEAYAPLPLPVCVAAASPAAVTIAEASTVVYDNQALEYSTFVRSAMFPASHWLEEVIDKDVQILQMHVTMWVNAEVWLCGLKFHEARLQSQGIVRARRKSRFRMIKGVLPFCRKKTHFHMALESQPSSFSSWSEQMLRHRQTT